MPSFRNAKAQAKHAVRQKLEIGHARHTNRDDKKRMDALQQQGFFYTAALEIVSQLIGHFRSTITEVYLR